MNNQQKKIAEIDKSCGNCKWLADCEDPRSNDVIVCQAWEEEQ